MTESSWSAEWSPFQAHRADADAERLTGQQPPALGGVDDSVPAQPHGIASGLLPLFLVLTGEGASDGWGKQAGQYIRHTRRTTKAGPTFSELFDALLSEQEVWSASFPWAARYHFRRSVAIHWRRTRWIRFTTNARSLSEGPASFRSRRHQKRTADE
jgi:hypothetical protein